MKNKFICSILVSLVLLMTSTVLGAQAFAPASVPASVPVYDQKHLKASGYFFVGGEYTGEKGKQLMQGQMYVEVLVPRKITKPYPLVLFHGAAQTATNWMGTPDGRMGWADFFLGQGYLVYMVDQPARGRSAYHPGVNGKLLAFSAEDIEKLFTTADGDWPQAKKHTQWPGEGPNKGRIGDPIFDAFYATQVEYIGSDAETQKLIQNAGAALLDKIGPAILVTHSQAGVFGLVIADVRPQLVKGIIALEPSGPPYRNGKRPWGITDIPLTYDPAAKNSSELAFGKVEADKADLAPGWLQKDPVRQLPNLRGIPLVIVTAEASYHAPYDHWTSQYLEQAGVKNTHIRLEDYGIRGNGHMMMLEKNNLEIAKLLVKWMAENVK